MERPFDLTICLDLIRKIQNRKDFVTILNIALGKNENYERPDYFDGWTCYELLSQMFGIDNPDDKIFDFVETWDNYDDGKHYANNFYLITRNKLTNKIIMHTFVEDPLFCHKIFDSVKKCWCCQT